MARRDADAEYRAEVEAARKRGDHGEVASLKAGRQAEEYFDHEEREIDFTKGLVRQAVEQRVPIPESPPYSPEGAENEFWAFSNSLGERYLTPLGVSTLRETLRREKDARRSERNHLIAWIGAITGLVGALTGLAAILRH